MAKNRNKRPVLLHHKIVRSFEAENKRSSTLTKDEFHLGKHDEEKMLLFVTGIVLGVGLGAGILGALWYGGVTAIIIALVLLLIEMRQ